ncbi:Ubiquitin-like-specific protease 1C [Platanthera guangdongensis]|uniref:Ubiquitin-like-specific protease 1C n=1 Tax=Platanthera guangdongensis TaxID=2320717 RepID=A0ABR2M3H3_9ASPA
MNASSAQVQFSTAMDCRNGYWLTLGALTLGKMHFLHVPQQKNEYDCGIFVLYFIERFLEEAPQRMRKHDLSMFHAKWFKPAEASNLRKKILDLLVEEFLKSQSPGVESP